MGQQANPAHVEENGFLGSSGREPAFTEAAEAPERIGKKLMIRRKDHIRLLQQALHKLGYKAVADRLQQESGIQMQPALANDFQAAILAGNFDKAISLLDHLIQSSNTLKQAKFRILQQKFVEQNNRGETAAALQTLRKELAPLQINRREVKRLSGYLLQRSEDAEQKSLKQTPWHQRRSDTRERVLQDLQQKLPPDLLLSDARLEALLEQSLQQQIDKCIFHNTLNPQPSLLRPYSAGTEQLPVQLHKLLKGHTDEVWHVQFSHLGDRLASASKDKTAIIWVVSASGEAKMQHVLKGHPDHVTHLTWSKDDSKMLTCSSVSVKIWNTMFGQCIRTVSHHTQSAAACAWFPDGLHFLSAGLDREIFMCNLAGHALRQWTMKARVNDVVITADSQVIVCITADKSIELMRLNDYVPVASIGDEAPNGPSAITSITTTPDGEYLLANFKDHTTHLWRLGPIARRIMRPLPDGRSSHPYGIAPREEEEDKDIMDRPMMEYHAGNVAEGRYVIRSCFGGVKSAFVASGSEDWRIYVWHRNSGRTLARLEGHTGTVNGVSWNPVHPHMLASASDDTTIGIWMAPNSLSDQPSFRGRGTFPQGRGDGA